MEGREPIEAEKIVAQEASEQERDIQQRGHREYYKGAVIEDTIKTGGRIVSDHPNIRGSEYHTVTVELPNGRRQVFSNVKAETLERMLSSQQQERGASFEHREHWNPCFPVRVKKSGFPSLFELKPQKVCLGKCKPGPTI